MISSLLLSLFLTAADVEDLAREKMQNIWSPYCPGNSLLECPSSKAEDLRSEIITRMKAGENFEGIFSDLQSRYGKDKLRMSPRMEGRESLAFALPWIALILGGIIILIYFFRRQNFPKPTSPYVPTDSQIEARVRQDLEDRLN